MLRFLACIAAYMIAVFPLAYWWHLVLFKTQLEKMGYLGRPEPIVPLGFAAIAIQGVLLALLVEIAAGGDRAWWVGGIVSVLFVATIWTAQVLAHAAKFDVEVGPFLPLETAYFIIQAVLVAGAVTLARALTD